MRPPFATSSPQAALNIILTIDCNHITKEKRKYQGPLKLVLSFFCFTRRPVSTISLRHHNKDSRMVTVQFCVAKTNNDGSCLRHNNLMYAGATAVIKIQVLSKVAHGALEDRISSRRERKQFVFLLKGVNGNH